MIRLRSYLEGEWVEPCEVTEELLNPATEERLGELGEPASDLRAAFDYAHQRGQPALLSRTFIERGEMLRKMATLIHLHREELIDISARSGGNTRKDAKFDIDGASSTLAFYADLGAELGEKRTLAENAAISLGRSKRFVGEHFWLPRDGVALHINAFNFPAWGFAEKTATALLAGMPVVTKPASETALLANRIFEIVIESNVVPEGVLSLITGKPEGLVECLRGQDVVAFTGSGPTASDLRGKLGPGIEMNIETDSTNAAVLGPDVESDMPCYEMFLRDVVQEMTQKAGQKCTAIRRILVPRRLEQTVRQDLEGRLSRVKVGDPVLAEVTMGPLVSARLREHVRTRIQLLTEEETDSIIGESGSVDPIGVPPGKGFFIGPVVLRAKKPLEAKFAHELEVFGPVATIFVYDGSPAEAIELVKRGGGSLVSSIYSDDVDFQSETALGVASYSGRLYLANSKLDGLSTAPGMVLPQLVHGGPGRAGGGEELGGLRGLRFYMQRMAAQGDRPSVRNVFQVSKLQPH